jgi:hypothetical protein
MPKVPRCRVSDVSNCTWFSPLLFVSFMLSIVALQYVATDCRHVKPKDAHALLAFISAAKGTNLFWETQPKTRAVFSTAILNGCPDVYLCPYVAMHRRNCVRPRTSHPCPTIGLDVRRKQMRISKFGSPYSAVVCGDPPPLDPRGAGVNGACGTRHPLPTGEPFWNRCRIRIPTQADPRASRRKAGCAARACKIRSQGRTFDASAYLEI